MICQYSSRWSNFKVRVHPESVGAVTASAFCEAIPSLAWRLLRRQKAPPRNDCRACSDSLWVYSTLPRCLCACFSQRHQRVQRFSDSKACARQLFTVLLCVVALIAFSRSCPLAGLREAFIFSFLEPFLLPHPPNSAIVSTIVTRS